MGSKPRMREERERERDRASSTERKDKVDGRLNTQDFRQTPLFPPPYIRDLTEK